MPESESAEVTEVAKMEISPRKRVRHRKKQLYENILKQMEFYFSDANLAKDRFLGDLVKNEPYVPLDTFLKFNKIRSLTSDIIDIVKSMKNSTLLELSEDKLKVKRKSPILPYDADSRTVYVESIPVTASREWLEKVFSDFGHVAYISLPKFKHSHKIKGYAFIEFDKPEDAQKCINTFTKMGCKLPTSMPPEELSSIKMFSIEETTVDNMEKNDDKVDIFFGGSPPKKKSKKNKEKKSQKLLELKLGSESDSEKKIDTPTDENKSIVPTPTEDTKSTDLETKDETTSHDEGNSDQELARKKKIRKKAKEKSKSKNRLIKNEAPKGALWGLQVLHKSEWKALRNKYLNLQRKYMKNIKTNLQNKRHTYSSIPAPAVPSVGIEPGISTETESSKNVIKLERIPGAFVKEVLSEPCLDVKHTKRMIRTNIHVQHVDVKEGQSEVIIRFDSAKAADDYCSHSGNRARALSGSEEEEQWRRAESGRGARRARGRCRLLARAHSLHAAAALAPASPQPTHTHIRFDE